MSKDNKFEPKIKSDYNVLYRGGLGFLLVFGLPMRYIHVHRRGLLDASRINKWHHVKELAVRLCIGVFINKILGMYLFGPACTDKSLSYLMGFKSH